MGSKTKTLNAGRSSFGLDLDEVGHSIKLYHMGKRTSKQICRSCQSKQKLEHPSLP